jgi:pimeloyl-ACP methyl ester carboxylesterase
MREKSPGITEVRDRMTDKTVLFLHGFASSGQGTKAQFFKERFAQFSKVAFHAFEFNPTPKDFEYMTITGLINRLRQYLLGQQPEKLSLIASSLGALVGLNHVHRFDGVDKMLLLAPLLAYQPAIYSAAELQQWENEGTINVPHYAFTSELPLRIDFHTDGLHYRQPVPPPVPVMIIHGQQDEVIPIARSRQYAASFPEKIQLIEVDSDHRLNDRLEFIWEQVQLFL